jgi:CheY-like chemotaxis protein
VLPAPVTTVLLSILLVAVLLAAGWLVWQRKARRGVRPRVAAPPPAPTYDRAPRPPARSLDSFPPLPPRAAPARPASAPRAAAPAAPASLLVVDDSSVARARLRKLFEGAGYLVDQAADGEEALALIASKPYAVLITDLEMPKIDGFQLIAAVQASSATEDLPIIAITGHEELSARVSDMKSLYGVFKKPWNDIELHRRVANLATLRRRRAGD